MATRLRHTETCLEQRSTGVEWDGSPLRETFGPNRYASAQQPVSALQKKQTSSAAATVHGTFGEFMQGYLAEGDGSYRHFLFTLPVEELKSTSVIRLGQPQQCEQTRRERDRAMRAAHKLACLLDISERFSVSIDSNIPIGKGCASSTADILATTTALIGAAYEDVPEPVANALSCLVAKEFEWGDYVLNSSIALCFQRSHQVVNRYSTDLRYRIVGIDEGDIVDTKRFHLEHSEDADLASAFADLASKMHRALERSDIKESAKLATESIRINQDVLPKRTFTTMERIGATTGALGVVGAHTGSMLGLLFSEHQDDWAERIRQATDEITARELPTAQHFTVRER